MNSCSGVTSRVSQAHAGEVPRPDTCQAASHRHAHVIDFGCHTCPRMFQLSLHTLSDCRAQGSDPEDILHAVVIRPPLMCWQARTL